MYSGYVDYKGLRLAQFSESRLARLQERVKKQFGLAKRAYKAAESQVILGETPGTATLEAIGVRVKCLRILKEAVDAKAFLEATDVPAHGEAVAGRHKAELDKALEQLRLAEAVGLGEDDKDLGPVLKARRLKAAQAKRQYDAASNMATYDAIVRRQVQAAQALVSAAERLTDLVADNSQDEAAVAVAEAAVNAAVAHWRQRRTASDKALNIIEASLEASAHDSTMASSFEVVGRSTAGSSTRPYEPDLAGSSFNTTAASRPSASASMAAASPSTSAPPAASRRSTSASAPGFGNLPEARANTSGFSNFFDFTPMAMSTPLPGLDETFPIGDVRSRASVFGYGPAAASSSSVNATGNQAAAAAVDVAPGFRPVASLYEHMPLVEARGTVKLKRGELPSRTLWVGRLRKEVGPAQLRQFIQGLGYQRIEKVRTGFGDSTYGDGKTHYYGWVTFADLDQAEDSRFRWDGRSDWDLTPKHERHGGRRLLHMSFCNNTKYTDDLIGDHGSDYEVE